MQRVNNLACPYAAELNICMLLSAGSKELKFRLCLSACVGDGNTRNKVKEYSLTVHSALYHFLFGNKASVTPRLA